MKNVASQFARPKGLLDDPFELIEVIPEPALIIDSSGIITHSNVHLVNLFGYPHEELQGKRLELVIPERHHPQYVKNLERCIKAPDQRTIGVCKDIHALHKNGLEIPIEIKLGSYTTEQGVFVFATIKDVTERYWAKAHLREREKRLSIILESARAIPWAANPVTWKFTYVGPQAVELLGYPIDDWYEKDFWINKIHPEDRETAIRYCAESSKFHSNYNFEYRMVKSDGDIIWFHDIVNVEYKNGEPYILRGFLIDITDNKQAEQKLQEEKQFSDSIIESLPGLFFMIDREHRYVRWNKNLETLTGCSGDQLLGKCAEDFTSPETRGVVIEAIERCFQEGSNRTEYENVGKDGQKIIYSGYGVRVHIGGNDYIVGIELDISKEKKIEKDAIKLRNELAHVNRVASMGELTASIAHELNQPLAAIMSNAQAAQHFLNKEQPDIEEVGSILTDIISDNKRGGEVIKHLRGMLVKGEPENALLDINDVIVEVIKLISNEALMKGVTIVFENMLSKSPYSQSSFIIGDRVQLQQVALNIMLNAFDALDASDKEERKLVIRVSQYNDDRLIVEFIDSGKGLTEQDIEKLFDAFYTSKQQGMGMGLAISRTIIETHGGKMGASQNKEGGATVYFSLPIAKESRE